MKIIIDRSGGSRTPKPVVTIDLSEVTSLNEVRDAFILAMQLDGFDARVIISVFNIEPDAKTSPEPNEDEE